MKPRPARGWLTAAADWLFPPRCASCRRLGQAWCAACQAQAAPLAEPQCQHCGYPLSQPLAACPACRAVEFAFQAGRAWASYAGSLRRAILKLKHKPNRALGQVLAAPLASVYPVAWGAQLLVAVPPSAQRLAQRGYNPVDLIAAPLAQHLGLPLAAEALVRQRHTLPQMDLQLEQRWANVQGAFVAVPRRVASRRVLLVDDIFTSGATLQAASQAVLAAGAASVHVLALARTL